MKKLILFLFAIILMLCLPLMSFFGTDEVLQTSAKKQEAVSSAVVAPKKSESVFRILDTSTNTVVSVGDREFCYGALAYEMPTGFHEEALKAQTVALYTFFSRKRNIERDSPSDELNGADFSADLSSGQFYISDDIRRKKWGSLYEKSMKIIKSAVDSVFGEVITDESGELIDACYHSASAGRTEASGDIFCSDREYLKPVPSPWDTDSPDFLTKVTVTAEEFRKKIISARTDVKLPASPDKYLSSAKKTASGSVTEAVIGGEKFTGSEIRTLFGLRSAAFDLSFSDGKFTFTVRGYGHGVGMSQWGAQGMAKQGSSYSEILSHYYQNTLLSKQNAV